MNLASVASVCPSLADKCVTFRKYTCKIGAKNSVTVFIYVHTCKKILALH